jgi:F-type H+-transporting ATPase subunit gamma
MSRVISGFCRWTNPGKTLPEILGGDKKTLASLIHEYLFVSLFRACRRMRQSGIDGELFDVISGFEAVKKEKQ